jgi:hypothetical protein
MYNAQHVNELLEYSNLQYQLDYYQELRDHYEGDDEESDSDYFSEKMKAIAKRMNQILVD